MPLPLLPDGPGPALPEDGRPHVSLCMIVRNEEAYLGDCLRSAADLVHEVVVVDTGSCDGTRDVAARYGARVYAIPWIDSFAAARNESICHATGDWIFWLDADERLDEDNRHKLGVLFAGLGDENVAFVMRQRSPLEASTHSVATVDHVRLFRNDPAIRWQYRVHEQILPAVRAAGGAVHPTDIVIDHRGFQDPAEQEPKVDRNLRLLLLEAAERPDDTFILFNLASVYLARRQGGEALPLLQRCLEQLHPSDTLARKTFALVARCHHQLGQLVEALAACRAGRRQFPDDPELLFWEAVFLREQGNLDGAAACFQLLLRLSPTTQFAAADEGMQSYKARQNLAEVYREMGRLAEAEAHWQAVVAERPGYLPAWLSLAELFAEQGRWAELEEAAGHLESNPQTAADASLWRARAHLGQRRFAEARQALEELIARAPDDLRPRILLTHAWLQEGGDAAAAEKALREVLQRDPRQAEVWYNLVTLLRQQQRTAEAYAACRAGQTYCPGNGDLLLLEAMVLHERGDPKGAETCLLHCLEGTPGAHDRPERVGYRRCAARHLLGRIDGEQGRDAEAEAQWRAVVAERSDWGPAWLELGHLYLRQNRWADLEQTIRNFRPGTPEAEEGELLQARALLARGEFAASRSILERLIAADPQALRPRVALSYAYLQEGRDWAAAEQVLRDVLALDASHQEARHNLAVLLRRRERGVEEAFTSDLTLTDLYQLACSNSSDINEHLPKLSALARECAHVTVLGVRGGQAVTAFLHAQPDRLVCYDPGPQSPVEALARVAGRTEFVFLRADGPVAPIEETDLLFLDTPHVYERRREELRRHAGRVRKYLVVHRTSVFGHDGEVTGTRGVWPALQEFLAEGSFRLRERLFNNNGLAILERVRDEAAQGNGPEIPDAPPVTAGTFSVRLRDRVVELPFAGRGPVDQAIVREVWDHDVYGVRGVAEPPATVLDVGAHIGAFALLAAEAWPGARVIACECDPENLRLLHRNVAGRANVEVVEAAVVGEDVREVEFHAVRDKIRSNSGGGSCFLREPGSVPTRVPAVSVVQLWREKNLSACDFLKLDCEGAELPILRALAEAGLLARVRLVVGEWHALDPSRQTGEAVQRELRKILQATHAVETNQRSGGMLGYFRARALHLP